MSHEFLRHTQKSIESAAKHQNEWQNHMQFQLQELIAMQQRGQCSLYSLDASSAEGRQTWMNLGRLLADEGITPEIIIQNRSALIQAMKDSLADSEKESFHTAAEYLQRRSKQRGQQPLATTIKIPPAVWLTDVAEIGLFFILSFQTVRVFYLVPRNTRGFEECSRRAGERRRWNDVSFRGHG